MNEPTQELKPWLNAIQEAEKNFIEIAEQEGSTINWKKEAFFAMQAVQKSEYLQACHPNTIRNAVINVATVGLTLNESFGYAYLVPRKGVACLDISYKGLLKLATDSGSLLWAKAVLVYETDKFEIQGIDRMPFHKFDPFRKDRGEIIGGYCAAKLHNGDYLIDTMSRDDLDHVRTTSKTDAIWSTWGEEMMKKTLIKRASKTWPATQRLDKAVTIINEHEGLEDKYINGTANQLDTAPVDAEKVLEVAEQVKEWIDADVIEETYDILQNAWYSLSNDERLRALAMLKVKSPDSGPRGKMYSTLLKEYLAYEPMEQS